MKTIVDLLLSNGFPTIALWGREFIQIYNDGYRDLMETKHPAGLGQPTRECWPEVWHIKAPIYDRVWAGETVKLNDALCPIIRSGVLQEAWFTLSFSPLRDAEGYVAGILVVLFETTTQHLIEERRRRAEAYLLESEARHRLLIESWAQAVWETDANGVVIADSPSWRAYTGQTLEEWLGYGWLDAIHSDDQAYAEQQWREAVAARRLLNAEFRLRSPNGRWRWTNVRAAPVLDAAGQVEKWVGMNIDIDDRKRSEAELLGLQHEVAQARIREGEERLRQFGEASQDVLWIRDTETMQWQYLTPAFETIYGLDRATALSGDHMTSWVELIVPEDRERAVESLQRVRAGERVTFEYRVRRPSDGSIRWLRDTDFPMRDAAGAVCWIGSVGRDITEEKETAEHMSVLVA
ncbi:PAS domain S-box protein, partial [Methylobacterium sp. Leaf86]|uniref:PAS domain-containing protein n=1 Tax=Methylobacterium sp. Leaf86 TaxID=1736242 RepID=UPI001FCE1623